MYFLINLITVICAFLIHYELLNRLSIVIPKLPVPHRVRILFALFGSLVAHVIEIWIFALVYFYMISNPGFGSLVGNFGGSLLDCGYYSFTTYTSLGFGDIVPHGDIRFLTGLEALTGLMLITWSASFLFIEMQKFWNNKN
jgi:hypothetical protein